MSGHYPSMQKLMDRVQHFAQGVDTRFAEATYVTTPTTLSCIISGSRSRDFDTRRGESIQYDYSVTVSWSSSIREGDKLVQGVNRYGTTVLVSGRIRKIREGIHPRNGAVLRELLVERDGT